MPMKLRQISLRAACALRSFVACSSVTGSPRASGEDSRIALGTTSSISASREATPSACSISRCAASSGPIWRAGEFFLPSRLLKSVINGPGGSCARRFLVRVRRQQLAHLLGVRELELEQPATLVRRFVHLLWRVRKLGVGFHHLTA